MMDTICAQLLGLGFDLSTSCVGTPRQHVIALFISHNARSVLIDCHADDEHHLCIDQSKVASI
jgi:hypothetical protein